MINRNTFYYNTFTNHIIKMAHVSLKQISIKRSVLSIVKILFLF